MERTVTKKQVLDSIAVIQRFCKEQKFCQSCILREYAPDHWECKVNAYDLSELYDKIKRSKQ